MKLTPETTLEQFAYKFTKGRISWQNVPRKGAIRNFGNIISLILFCEAPFQVELFIVPFAYSSFTLHRHPDVDVIEFGLSGYSTLEVNGMPPYTLETTQAWLNGSLPTGFIRIYPTDWHSGKGFTPYSFLSIQKWLNGVSPTSVGLNWEGQASSLAQAEMLLAQESYKNEQFNPIMKMRP